VAIDIRFATLSDVPALARMNQALLCDEGHRSPLTLQQLETRMAGFLVGDYRAALFAHSEATLGYALWRPEEEWVHLRQCSSFPKRAGRASRAPRSSGLSPTPDGSAAVSASMCSSVTIAPSPSGTH
jgi:hypothetical protein